MTRKTRYFSLRVFLFGSCLLLWSNNLLAENSATVLSSEIDFSLIYVDGISRPQTNTIYQEQHALHVPEDDHSERGLGLKHAKVAFTLESIHSSKFYVLLRPDATMNRGDTDGISRDTDTRAGLVYRDAADLRLLDAYQLTIRPGTGMSLGVGVWEQLSVPALAYQQVLQPGLEVLFPEKFSGLRLRWNKFQPVDPANVGKRQKGMITDFYVIQGDRDRVEQNVGQNETDDHAPGSVDPHYGGAVTVNWIPSDSWSLLLTGGTLASEEYSGKSNNVFGELNAIFRVSNFMHGLTTSVLIRQSKETYRDTPVAIDDRINQSAGLLMSLGIVSGTSFISGFTYGRGEFPADKLKPTENSDFSGYQVEFGFQNEAGKNLILQGILAQERRTKTDAASVRTGAFFDGTNSSNQVRRVALQVSYQMSGLE